jgi:hypothetical protein
VPLFGTLTVNPETVNPVELLKVILQLEVGLNSEPVEPESKVSVTKNLTVSNSPDGANNLEAPLLLVHLITTTLEDTLFGF